MNANESLYAVLSSIFNDEFYPVKHPDIDGTTDTITTDFAIYKQVGGTGFPTLSGNSGIRRLRFQISIFSLDYDRMKQLSTYVEQAMIIANDVANSAIALRENVYETPGALINVPVGEPIEDFENDTKRFYCHVDYYIWEKPTTV